jgi:hypothetical protein
MKLVVIDGSEAKAADDLPLVTLAAHEVLVGSDHVADLTPGPLGFDATLKRNGQRAALEVVPLKASLAALHTRTPSVTTVRLLVDADTSYRAALEVIFSASHAGFTDFVFVVSKKGGEGALPASTPSKAEWEAAHTAGAPQPPSFVLRPEGVTVTVGGEPVGAGCVHGASGIAIAPASGHLDTEKTRACAARIKTMAPGWAGVVTANVSADASLDMQTVLEMVAALRSTYPVIHFGMLTG